MASRKFAHGHGHGQTAENQHHGVVRAEHDVQFAATEMPGLRKHATVHNVAKEQPAEEHDFGEQENPDPEGGRLFLLLEMIKMVS